MVVRPLEKLITKSFGNTLIKTLGPFKFIPFECRVWEICVYEKCSFRCVYCSAEAQGKSKPALCKEDITHYLDSFKQYGDSSPLLMSGLSDPYPPEEEEHRLTCFLIQELTKRELHFQICTKSTLILNDIELLKNNPCLDQVCFSLALSSDELIKKLEPGAPSFAARVDAITQLADANIPVFVNICPWIPGLTDVMSIANHFSKKVTIKVGALSYMHHIEDLKKNLFGVTKASAEKVFGSTWTSQEINAAFLKEYKRVGAGQNGNIRWLALSGSGDNFSLLLPKFPENFVQAQH